MTSQLLTEKSYLVTIVRKMKPSNWAEITLLPSGHIDVSASAEIFMSFHEMDRTRFFSPQPLLSSFLKYALTGLKPRYHARSLLLSRRSLETLIHAYRVFQEPFKLPRESALPPPVVPPAKLVVSGVTELFEGRPLTTYRTARKGEDSLPLPPLTWPEIEAPEPSWESKNPGDMKHRRLEAQHVGLRRLSLKSIPKHLHRLVMRTLPDVFADLEAKGGYVTAPDARKGLGAPPGMYPAANSALQVLLESDDRRLPPRTRDELRSRAAVVTFNAKAPTEKPAPSTMRWASPMLEHNTTLGPCPNIASLLRTVKQTKSPAYRELMIFIVSQLVAEGRNEQAYAWVSEEWRQKPPSYQMLLVWDSDEEVPFDFSRGGLVYEGAKPSRPSPPPRPARRYPPSRSLAELPQLADSDNESDSSLESLEQVDGLTGFLEGLMEFEPRCPSITRFCAFVVAVVQAPSISAFISVAHLYLSSGQGLKMVDGLIKRALTRLATLLRSAVSTLRATPWRFEGKSESLPKDWLAWAMEQGKLGSACMTMSASIFSESIIGRCLFDLLNCFSLASVTAATGWILSPEDFANLRFRVERLMNTDDMGRKGTFDTVVTKVVAFTRTAIRVVVEAAQAGDIRLLFAGTFSYEEWKGISHALIYDEALRALPNSIHSSKVFLDRRAKKEIPDYFTRQLPNGDLCAEMDKFISIGENLAVRHTKQGATVADINKMLHALRTTRCVISNLPLHQAQRVQPFAVYLYGKPMTGKSNLVETISTAVARVGGYFKGVGSSFKFSPTSNFADGFKTSMWHGAFDDVDQGMAPEAAGVRNHAQLVIEVVNNAPLNMEAADVESKGKNDAAFLLVTYASNFANARLKGKIVDPTPFWRRFPVRVKVVVDKEYANKSGGLDLDKALDPATGALLPGVRTFTIEAYQPGDAKDPFSTPPYRVVQVVRSEVELMRVLMPLYVKHHKRQRNLVMDMIAPTHDEVFCQHCGLNARLHVGIPFPCVVETHEGFLLGAGLVMAFHERQRILRGAGLISSRVAISAFSTLLRAEQWWARQVPEAARLDVSGGLLALANGDALTDRQTLSMFATAGTGLAIAMGAYLMHARSVRKKSDHVECIVWANAVYEGVDPALTPKGVKTVTDGYVQLNHRPPRPFISNRHETTTVAEMVKAVATVTITVSSEWAEAHGILLGSGCILINKHVLCPSFRLGAYTRADEPSETVRMRFAYDEQDPEGIIVNITRSRWVTWKGRDVAVLYVPEVIKTSKFDILKHLAPTPQLTQPGFAADSGGLAKNGLFIASGRRLAGSAPMKVGAPVPMWVGNYESGVGDCGLPVIATFGQIVLFVGLHSASAGHDDQRVTGAEEITNLHIGSAISGLTADLPDITNMHLDYEAFLGVKPEELEALPRRSSVAATLVAPFPPALYFLGSSRKLATTRRLKSHVVDTWFRPQLADFEREFCGASPYFKPPIFDGKMEGDLWMDPYVRNLLTTRNSGGCMSVWRWCINDYLRGVGELPGGESRGALSDHETLLGIDGTFIGGTNLSTSAGPPFFKKKHQVVAVERPPVGEPVARWSPAVQAVVEEIQAAWARGEFVPAACIHSLKDEPLNDEKNAAHKVRVFNNLSLAYNFLTKKYLARIVEFMRSQPQFFESVMGMNLTSAQIDVVVDWIEEYEHEMAADARDYDMRASTLEMIATVSVFEKIGLIIGYNEHERDCVNKVLMGLIYMLRVVRGEIFLTAATMPTGCWMTLAFNCVRNCLQCRYAWFRLWLKHKKSYPEPFRSYNRLWVMGDDNWSSVAPSALWYNQQSVADALGEIGVVRTSCIKGRELTKFETRETVTFLKRRFIVLDGVRVCPIEPKTLAKMLCVKGKSALSDVDHHCTAVSNVMAESWMHGRAFFDRMKGVVEPLVSKHQLSGPYLRIFSYEEYRTRYARGELSLWNPLENAEGSSLTD
jgi:hypothetical protein